MCPLCGAMLRQARNLRRHLLTSCKYRMMGPAGLPVALGPGGTAVAAATTPGPAGMGLQALTPQQLLMDAAAEMQLQQQRLSMAHQQQPPPPLPPPPLPPPVVASQQHSSTSSSGSPAEHIVCKVSPLPSPMSSCSNLMSPVCTALMSPQPAMVPPQ